MAAIILRRRKLGRTSCREVARMSTTGIKAIRNDKRMPEDVDLTFRWGCTSDAPSRNVVNTASAIHEVCDKVAFRMKLDEAELCPATWDSIDDVPPSALVGGVVVRPAKHSQGRKIRKVHTEADLIAALYAFGEGSYFAEYVPKVAEYRVFIVQGRTVAVAQKTPGDPDALAWNVNQGGRFDNVSWDNWPLKAVRIATEAFELSSLDFGGVDVMVAEDGSCTVLEINSAPSLTSPYRQECFAKAFDYIVNNGKERIPRIEGRGGYRKFIHPAVCDRAQLVEV